MQGVAHKCGVWQEFLGAGWGVWTFGETEKIAVRKEESAEVVEFARTRLGFWPDTKQEELLRSGAARGIVNCSRQWGKSTVAAAMAVHRAYFRPGEPGGGGVPDGAAERRVSAEGCGIS